MELQVCSVVVNSKVTDAKLLMLQQYTERDHEPQSLCRIIRVGWPEKLQKVSPELKQYWTYREDLSYAYGLVLKGKAILYLGPFTLLTKGKKSAYKKQVEQFFGMASDVPAFVENCEVCKEFRKSNYRQPLFPHPIPD
ncbi:hypothetical protein PR048_001199 [Dryococelus australis]|uniref:Uncharacterized protein n=1 Tax=Dryococelus australis TaxID=614101 RepID=A0ABQ9IGU0_9NEOP|nr:hypothetical protein PR048_001199 [Dryococelus australis]